MKRLGYVRVLRGIIVPGMIGASYAVPKEVFSQNTLRRNRRNACDLAPHAVGLTGLFASTAQLYYSANILQYWFVFSVVSTLFVWIDSRGIAHSDCFVKRHKKKSAMPNNNNNNNNKKNSGDCTTVATQPRQLHYSNNLSKKKFFF